MCTEDNFFYTDSAIKYMTLGSNQNVLNLEREWSRRLFEIKFKKFLTDRPAIIPEDKRDAIAGIFLIGEYKRISLSRIEHLRGSRKWCCF